MSDRLTAQRHSVTSSKYLRIKEENIRANIKYTFENVLSIIVFRMRGKRPIVAVKSENIKANLIVTYRFK